MSKKIKVKKLEGSTYAIEHDIAGKGATATIVRAYNTQNLHEELACKIISLREQQNNSICKTQLLVLKELPHHPNLVNYKKIQISSERNLYLIMQFCNGGNLEKYLFDNKYIIPEEKIWFFLKQFCEGYKILYQNFLIHRDIKTQNILIHNGAFKIADFGLSKVTSHPQMIQNLSIKGTPIYMAPQIPELKQGNSKIDIFSLGVVLYRLAFKGEYPFFDQGRKYRSINQYFKQLKVRKLIIPENHDKSPELITLIKQMLDKDHKIRISWPQMFEHPKIVKALNCNRKKQMTNMENFKKSLIFVNRSAIKISKVQDPNSSQQSTGQEACLILEQAFSNNKKSIFQKKLYRYKLLYTIIEYVNTKINKYLKKKENIHKHIKKTLKKIIVQGLQFGLFVINSLRDISGQWDQFNTYEINNFQNIFENDRQILQDALNHIIEEEDNKSYSSHLGINQGQLSFQKKSKIIKLSYEDILYRYLTEYYQYPKEMREQLRAISVLLVDIYDLVLKFESSQSCKQPDDSNQVYEIEDEEKDAFYNYLINSEKKNENQLFISMRKKGLIFK